MRNKMEHVQMRRYMQRHASSTTLRYSDQLQYAFCGLQLSRARGGYWEETLHRCIIMPVFLVYSTVAPVSHKTCYEFMRPGLLVRPQVTEYGFKIMSLVVSIYELTSSCRSNTHFVGKCFKSYVSTSPSVSAPNMGTLCLPCWYSLVLTTLPASRSHFDSASLK